MSSSLLAAVNCHNVSGYEADHRLGLKPNNKMKPEENDNTVSGECHYDHHGKIVFPALYTYKGFIWLTY